MHDIRKSNAVWLKFVTLGKCYGYERAQVQGQAKSKADPGTGAKKQPHWYSVLTTTHRLLHNQPSIKALWVTLNVPFG